MSPLDDHAKWWGGRRPGERTTIFLGRVLDDLALSDMARRAREGHFDDYFCPAEVDDGLNLLRLVGELEAVARRPDCGAARRQRIRVVIEAVKAGEFDGTKEESDRWAASKQGQETFRQLLGGGG